MPDTEAPAKMRSRTDVRADRDALDQIARILDTPITCKRSEIPAIDRATLEHIGEIVDRVRPGRG